MNFAEQTEKKELIKKMMGADELLSVFCLGTNMPLVDTDPESFNDRVFVFENEEVLKDYIKPYLDKKMPLRGVKFLQKDKMQFFTTLLFINVDEILYVQENEQHVIQLSEFLKKQDFSDQPKERRPLENPALQLSSIYFVQEACRSVPMEEKTTLKELEEEMAANLVKAMYILPVVFVDKEKAEEGEVEVTDEKMRQFRIPLVKTPKGDQALPLFTDNVEFAKFNREGKCNAMVVPFKALSKFLPNEARCYVLNPNGFHLELSRELLNGLCARFGIEVAPAPVNAAAKPEAAATEGTDK